MSTKSAIADYLLKEERALIPRLFLLPFRNALMKGATMDDEAVAYIKKIRWILVIICVVMLLSIEPSKVVLPSFLAAFMAFGVLVFYIMLIGYRHRDVVPTDEVALFDLNVAKSGGLWGALGLGIWSLIRLFFVS